MGLLVRRRRAKEQKKSDATNELYTEIELFVEGCGNGNMGQRGRSER